MIKSLKISLALSFCLVSGYAHADSSQIRDKILGAKALLHTYQTLKAQLQNNPYNAPFYLSSDIEDSLAAGDVFAVLPFAYAVLAENLADPNHWCDAMILHINVKGCTSQTEAQPQAALSLYIGKKEYQHTEDAYSFDYEFSMPARNDDYTLIHMNASSGPLGAKDSNISIEFSPLNDSSSFIHFAYSARYGGMANLALHTYLATLGRNKVGFTMIDTDDEGQPVYIKGMNGLIERNAMRYFFALQSYFDTLYQPEAKRLEARINRWFDYVEMYPRQLREVERQDYVQAKQQEYVNSKILNGASY